MVKMSSFSTVNLVANCSGKVLFFLLFMTVEACVWLYEVWKRVALWCLNLQILIITRWVYWVPDLQVVVHDIGLFSAYEVTVKWKNEVILSAEELHVGLEWKLTNLRNASFRLHVKNLFKRIDKLELIFTFNLYWRILPSPTTSTGLEQNQELKDEIKPKLTRLHATDGRIIIRPSKDAVLGPAPKILLKVKAAEAVFIKGVNVFIISGRANRLSCWLKGRVHDQGNKRKDHLINMACLRLKFVFPKDSPNQLSHRFHGTRIRITRSNLKDVLWSVNGFKSIFSDISDGGEEKAESPKALVPHNNEQIQTVKVTIEDFVISIGTHSIPEIAAIKVSLDITADTWAGKSRCSGALGIQGVSVSDIHAVDPCMILGNDLITASWRCSFTSTHVYKRCLIMNAESSEILSLILRPDCLSVLAHLQEDYSFFTENTGPSSLTQFGENIKLIIKEHSPRTQVSSTLEGVNVCLEMDVFEQLAACTLEDIRVQCTQDTENFSCDFTVKDIEVEDRINNVLAVRKLSKDGIHKRSLHATIIQDATSERRSISFQQLYGELVDLNISLEEELLLKLLVFFGITEKKQLWGEEKSENTKSLPSQPSSSESQSPHEEEVSFFFERLEVNGVGIVISVSPNQDLPEDLVKLKEQLGVPNGLPPCVENARLDFARFLRTGIYYRSYDGMARDVKRHYLKEIGRQSAKILGSLHLLGNVTGLKDNIAEGLTELKETGDYMGFARHVRSGLTDSYYKLTDSWTAYVKPSPRKSLAKPIRENRIEEQTNEDNVDAGLFHGITSGLGGLIFGPLDYTTELSQEDVTDSVAAEIQSPVSSSTPQRDLHTQERDIPRDTDPTISTFMRDGPCTTQQNQPSDIRPECDLSNELHHIIQRDEEIVTQSPCSLQRDAPRDVNNLNDASQHDVTNDVNVCDVPSDFISVLEDDTQSTWASMSNFQTPTGWELMPRELQKRLKGQEFLKRLKQSINNDEDPDEKFLCCLKLRYTEQNNKLNALLTTSKVYFMKVGSPLRSNVVLEVQLNRLYKTQEKNQDGKDYLELIMRMNGMQRLCLPSPNAGDNPLVRCDTLHLAAKAANKINKARKRYSSNESCPCKVILNTIV